jgi:hypothetical protein
MVIRGVVQNCQFSLVHSSFLFAIAMVGVPIPKVSAASDYDPILPIFLFYVKLLFSCCLPPNFFFLILEEIPTVP